VTSDVFPRLIEHTLITFHFHNYGWGMFNQAQVERHEFEYITLLCFVFLYAELFIWLAWPLFRLINIRVECKPLLINNQQHLLSPSLFLCIRHTPVAVGTPITGCIYGGRQAHVSTLRRWRPCDSAMEHGCRSKRACGDLSYLYS